MLKINSESLPKLIVNNIAYMFYYSIQWSIVWFLIILLTSHYSKDFNIPSDYLLFMLSLTLGVIFGYITNLFVTPIEKKIIKRNIFVAGLINVLKSNNSIVFGDIVKNYSYYLFQNRKVTSWDFEWASYIEALISLGIIDLVNHNKLLCKDKNFDYKFFNKVLFQAELKLIDKKVDVDKLIARLDNYVL